MVTRLKFYLMGMSRSKKYHELLKYMNPDAKSLILDVGVADEEYSPFDNYFEKNYPHRNQITALSIYPLKRFSSRYPDINVVTYRGGKFPFDNKQFDIAISNAVIEHVGDASYQIEFVKELFRVSKQIYFTTPAREFPIEMHTNIPVLHWLPKRIFDNLLRAVGKNWATGTYMNLLTKKQLNIILKKAGIRKYEIKVHRLGPFPLHYIVTGC